MPNSIEIQLRTGYEIVDLKILIIGRYGGYISTIYIRPTFHSVKILTDKNFSRGYFFKKKKKEDTTPKQKLWNMFALICIIRWYVVIACCFGGVGDLKPQTIFSNLMKKYSPDIWVTRFYRFGDNFTLFPYTAVRIIIFFERERKWFLWVGTSLPIARTIMRHTLIFKFRTG